MRTNLHEPADTRSMGIVHSALRRDLRRTRIALEAPPYPERKHRRQLAAHVLWLMHVLHLHHTAEDSGLWPFIRARNPAAGALLDQMDADHKRIAPAIRALEDAARTYRADESSRTAMLDSLTALETVLLPHLRREELDMMPIVGATITTAEYLAIEQEYFVKPKGFRELGAEGPWIIDGLDPEGREVILHVIPAVPRFILLHTFGWSYRRKTARLWRHGPATAVPSLSLATMEDNSQNVATIAPAPPRQQVE